MKQIFIAAGVIGLLLYFSTASAAPAPEVPTGGGQAQGKYVGYAIRREGSNDLYKAVRMLKVKYNSTLAWQNSGAPEIITLPADEFDNIGEITNAIIADNGKQVLI